MTAAIQDLKNLLARNRAEHMRLNEEEHDTILAVYPKGTRIRFMWKDRFEVVGRVYGHGVTGDLLVSSDKGGMYVVGVRPFEELPAIESLPEGNSCGKTPL